MGHYPKSKSRRDNLGGFAGIPRDVMRHPDYIGLKASARSVLQELAFQYRGKNNGDLTLAMKVMKLRGFNSPNTVNKAKKELLAADLIRETRKGFFQNPGGVCCLFALTWQPIDECQGKLDCKSTIKAPRSFKLNSPIQNVYRLDTESVSVENKLN